MTRWRGIALILTAGMLIGSSTAGAETPPFETPASNSFCLFEPFGWQMEFSGSTEHTASSQCFDVTVFRDSQESCRPTCTVEAFGQALASGAGVIFVGTHGDSGFFVIEAYENTEEGLAARNQAYEEYLSAGWLPGCIVGTSDWYGYGIAITGFGIMSRFNDSNTIIYVAACHSCTAVYGFQGAREILCYDAAETIVQVGQDAGLFWSAMNGDICRPCRAVAVAAGPLYNTLRHFQGPGSTVLSPGVCATSPADGALLETLEEGWIAFDTRMNTALAPRLDVQGPALVGEVEWVNDTCFVFETAPYETGFCSICVSSSMKSAGGRGLDGNRNPPGSIARGPTGDPHCMMLYAEPDDPATRWGGLWAYETPGGVSVEWTTEVERESRRFDVLGFRGDHWVQLESVDARGGSGRPAFYSVDVADGTERFMISEVDARGHVCRSRPFVLESGPPPHRELARRQDEWSGEETRVAVSGGCACPGTGGARELRVESWPHYVFYGPDSLLAEVSPVVDWWTGEGIRAHLEVSTTGDPCRLFSFLQDLTAAADSLGAPRPAVIIVGDANEGGEPEKNIVGTLYFQDTTGACYFSDYCSAEHDLSDVDSDGLADLDLARIPADRRAEVARSVQTFLHWVQGAYPETALFLSGDLDEGDVTADPLDVTLAEVRAMYEGSGIPTIYRRDGDYDWSDYWTRQQDVAGDLNSGVTEVFAMGAISNRNRTPGMFIQKVVTPWWEMDWLAGGPSPFVFWGPGCGMADIDRDNPVYDPVLAEMFLFGDPDRPAAVAWVSHGRGHWSTCHILFARELANRRFSGEPVDILDCFTQAKNSCVTKYPQTRDYVRSLCFLGWPVAMPGMGVGGLTVPDTGPGPGSTLACHPNPFNPSLTLRYSTECRARVVMDVYGVSGRSVIRLVDQDQLPGVHETVWDGLDARGVKVSSGVYFVRMTVGTKSSTSKIVMAR